MRFVPQRAFFEPAAMEYGLGRRIHDQLRGMGIPVQMTGSHNRVAGIPGKTAGEAYREAKQTLVVGVRRGNEFQTCKPSAHFQLPIATSCPSMCEYCYLATTLGKKPYVRIYVNLDEILGRAAREMAERAPEVTVFEGAATSDPVPTEYLTGHLRATVEFFADRETGLFRFVTKHADVETLLTARHNGRTRCRYSLNAAPVIARYEHRTEPLEARIGAAAALAGAGYPVGFIIAPIFHYPGWLRDYGALVEDLDRALPREARRNLVFELITHRFTARAKTNILDIFPETALPLEESERKFRFGQFGYGKYVYSPEVMAELREGMTGVIAGRFPEASVSYFV